MRIVAGSSKSRKIITPKSMDTRPTSARVRESLFSIISAKIPQALVLDMFAGSGALGLEALSRGAARAVFIDLSKEAISCIRKNINTLGYSGIADVIYGDAVTKILKLSEQYGAFDLIFLDPPYASPIMQSLPAKILSAGLLSPNGLMVYEHSKEQSFTLPPGLILTDKRKYGDISISLIGIENPSLV